MTVFATAKRIPFSYERYLAGGKPVIRNGEHAIAAVYCLEDEAHDTYPIQVVFHGKDNKFWTDVYKLDGKFRSSANEDEHELDLLIEESQTEFYLNIYSRMSERGWILTYDTLKEAKEASSFDCIGQLKVSYNRGDIIK